MLTFILIFQKLFSFLFFDILSLCPGITHSSTVDAHTECSLVDQICQVVDNVDNFSFEVGVWSPSTNSKDVSQEVSQWIDGPSDGNNGFQSVECLLGCFGSNL